jgi:hypothetical protein
MFDGRLIMHDMHDDDLQHLMQVESNRLRNNLDSVPPSLAKVIDAAAMAHARRIHAERMWSEEGKRPDSPWLKVARDALRDYQSSLRLLLKHIDDAETPRDLFAIMRRE